MNISRPNIGQHAIRTSGHEKCASYDVDGVLKGTTNQKVLH
jgi:hypothetical protein